MTDHLDGGYAAAARRKQERAAARAAAADSAAPATADSAAPATADSAAPATADPVAPATADSVHTVDPADATDDESTSSTGSAGGDRAAMATGGTGEIGSASRRGTADGETAAAAAGDGSAGGRSVAAWWGRVVGGGGSELETVGERRVGRVVLSVGLLLVGMLFAVAYRGTIRTAPESERARQALVRDVESGSALSDSLQRQAENLSGQLVRERDAVLTRTATGERATRDVRRLEAAAALVPVTGPGITVVIGDASAQDQVDPLTGQTVSVPADDSGRLRDRDLQSVVNALWAAGAEAISVGGQRLAPTTTIRAAGEAILVDLRPVTSPYAIEAVGDPGTLLARFADSEAARRYQSYTGLYGIRFTVNQQDSLTLRAATGPELRYAEPVPAATPAPQATPTTPSTASTPTPSAGPTNWTGRSLGGGG